MTALRHHASNPFTRFAPLCALFVSLALLGGCDSTSDGDEDLGAGVVEITSDYVTTSNNERQDFRLIGANGPAPAHVGHFPAAPRDTTPYVILRADRGNRRIAFHAFETRGAEAFAPSSLKITGWHTRYRRKEIGSVIIQIPPAAIDRLNEAQDGADVKVEIPGLGDLTQKGARWFDCDTTIYTRESFNDGSTMTGWSHHRTLERIDTPAPDRLRRLVDRQRWKAL